MQCRRVPWSNRRSMSLRRLACGSIYVPLRPHRAARCGKQLFRIRRAVLFSSPFDIEFLSVLLWLLSLLSLLRASSSPRSVQGHGSYSMAPMAGNHPEAFCNVETGATTRMPHREPIGASSGLANAWDGFEEALMFRSRRSLHNARSDIPSCIFHARSRTCSSKTAGLFCSANQARVAHFLCSIMSIMHRHLLLFRACTTE
jgi:hypothetical protein